MVEVEIMTHYEELFNQFGFIEAQAGINEDGEYVIVSIDENCASVRTLQSNQWQRINIYYKDGVEDEYYEN